MQCFKMYQILHFLIRVTILFTDRVQNGLILVIARQAISALRKIPTADAKNVRFSTYRVSR